MLRFGPAKKPFQKRSPNLSKSALQKNRAESYCTPECHAEQRPGHPEPARPVAGFLRETGLEETHEYVDQASGKNRDRPQFKAMIDSAARGQFDRVLFWSLDRFSREGVLETLQYLRTLTSYVWAGSRSPSSISIAAGSSATRRCPFWPPSPRRSASG
jgi:hypothetical protein